MPRAARNALSICAPSSASMTLESSVTVCTTARNCTGSSVSIFMVCVKYLACSTWWASFLAMAAHFGSLAGVWARLLNIA